MGVVARTPLQVPGPVDQASSKSEIAQFAKSEAEQSTDALVVGEAGSWMHETSRILGLTRTGYDPLSVEWLKVAAEWLKRAEALDNTEELIEMYESDLYRDVSSKIIPPEPTRIKLPTDEAPRPSKTVEASCPAGSTALSQSAGIDVRLIIATDGQVRFALRKGLSIQEIHRRETAGIPLKTPPVLLKSALDAARQYRFPLTYRNGNAVEVETTITVAVCK